MVISNSKKLEIFQAQIENLKYLEKVWKHINRAINEGYRTENKTLIEINTKLLIQIYCAYAESTLSKLIHTPYGLTSVEISQIKKIGKNNTIKAWKKCLELSIRKVSGNKSNHKPNVIKKIHHIIDTYIQDPSLLRNKIAHGQWKKALNSTNTDLNNDLTTTLDSINIIDLYKYKTAFLYISKIIEDIIESPNKAHRRQYWIHIEDYEKKLIEINAMTIEAKKLALKKKKEYYKN